MSEPTLKSKEIDKDALLSSKLERSELESKDVKSGLRQESQRLSSSSKYQDDKKSGYYSKHP